MLPAALSDWKPASLERHGSPPNQQTAAGESTHAFLVAELSALAGRFPARPVTRFHADVVREARQTRWEFSGRSNGGLPIHSLRGMSSALTQEASSRFTPTWELGPPVRRREATCQYGEGICLRARVGDDLPGLGNRAGNEGAGRPPLRLLAAARWGRPFGDPDRDQRSLERVASRMGVLYNSGLDRYSFSVSISCGRCAVRGVVP